MVDLASKHTIDFALIREGNVCDLPYPKEQFDLITAVETLYFWQPLKKALANIHQTLKKNGKFIIIHEMYNDPENNMFKERNKRIQKLSSLSLFTPQELADILNESGFKTTYSLLEENNWIVYSAEK